MDDEELRARNLIRVDPEKLGIELPHGYMIVYDAKPLLTDDERERMIAGIDTLLGIPDLEATDG